MEHFAEEKPNRTTGPVMSRGLKTSDAESLLGESGHVEAQSTIAYGQGGNDLPQTPNFEARLTVTDPAIALPSG